MSKSKLFKFLTAIPALILCLPAFAFLQQNFSEPLIVPAENYPRWLMNDNYRTSQTSGITYLKKSEDGSEEFLLADDIGNIHRLFIKDDTIFNFRKIEFSQEVVNYLKDFPKPDFEEILYDKFTGKVYITIEGNGKEHKLFHGVYLVKFKNDDINENLIDKLEKIDFSSEEKFYKDLKPNTGYEGLATDENYFYFGLEAVLDQDRTFSNNTVIRIADKKTLQIVKELSTDTLGIATIGGLFSDYNFSLWGIDRNQKKVFKLILDEYLNVVEFNFFEISAVIPKNKQFNYVGSLESITITPDQNIFLVDDPWTERFVPQIEILEKLDKETIENFKNMMPIIYKYYVE